MNPIDGIHHISLITGDARANVDFYVRVLGLRLVKRTVNQDDPAVYHLFYADEYGSPGADITFFEYPGTRAGRAGAGMIASIIHRVASEEALIVPTILDADIKSLGQIAREARRLAERVRSGQITPPELSGATFTVSNLGMYGMTAITPVINPPQAAILGVGATRATLARDPRGEIVQRTLMTLTLSCDHRVLYGADAARFLAEIRDLLQAPLRILL
jgi:catechol 2,3-dioxygenase-like lactoylglutathione lyase family enzyme